MSSCRNSPGPSSRGGFGRSVPSCPCSIAPATWPERSPTTWRSANRSSPSRSRAPNCSPRPARRSARLCTWRSSLVRGLRARMRAVVDLAQAACVDVAVDLRRRERAVAEQLLDRAEIGAALEQVGGEGVAETMGMRRDATQRARVEPVAAHGEEQGVVGARGEGGACFVQVARHPVRRLLAEWDDALLAALAVPDVDELLLEVDVCEVEADGFRAPQAGRVHELDEGAVPQVERPFALERGELLVEVGAARRLGKAPHATGRDARVGYPGGAEGVAQE